MLLLNSLRSLIKKYRRSREVKHQFLSLPIKLKSGTWHIGDGLFWQSAEDKKKVEELFFRFYLPKQLTTKLWRAQVIRLVERILAVSTFSMRTGSANGPSVIFKSRGGALKLYDFDNSEVITLISGETADNLNYAKTLSIFDFFTLNPFVIDQSLRSKRNLCIRREALVDVPCMAMASLPIQIQTMKKICSTYIGYAQNYAMDPAQNIFEDCFDEVAGRLTDNARAQCLMMRDKYLEFVRVTRTVLAHLDFNITNLIDDGDLFLFDIEDAGLRLPVTYDMVNLLLNEAYQDRPASLLMEVLKDEHGTGYSELFQIATGMISKDQLGTSLFVNYILRESRYVSERLLKNFDADLAQPDWDKLARYIPGWPFIQCGSST